MAKKSGIRIVTGETVLEDLRKLAAGKRAAVPASEVAWLAIRYVEAGLRDRELEQLEALYALPDTRS
jgi:hypothetical protein